MRYYAALTLVVGLAAPGLTGSGLAHATTIYTNFGPGNSYATGSGSFIDEKPSISFVSGSDQVLDEVDFAAYLNGSDSQVTVSVSADASGHPGASALASDVLTATLTPAILQWVLATPQPLTNGSTYWITLSVATQDSVVWNYNDQTRAGDSRLISGVWAPEPSDTQGAIDIIGSQVDPAAPEPATGLLLVLPVGAIVLHRRRKPSTCQNRA